MTGGHRVAAAILGTLALSPAMAADDLPGPSLQISRQLTLPPDGKPIDETERSLLRVEWKVAQSGADESVAVDDMLLRLRQVGRSVAELQQQMAVVPTPRSLRRLPPPDPIPAEPEADSASGYWLPTIGGIAALSLLFVTWRNRRRRPLMEEKTFEPANATQTALLPGTPSREPAMTLASPTIANDQAVDAEPPPIEYDQPSAPLADDQIPLELADVLVSMGLVERRRQDARGIRSRASASRALPLVEAARRLSPRRHAGGIRKRRRSN